MPNYGAEYGAAAANVFRLQSLTAAVEVDVLEAALTVKYQRPAVAVSSGTAAIHTALLTLGVDESTTVAVPGVGFPAGALAAIACGARLVVVDVHPDTGLIDVDQIPEDAIVVAIDLDGQLPDYSALATRWPVVEDACAAWGSTRNGRLAGTYGLISALSFNGTKIVGAGEGGALVTHTYLDAQRARRISRFGERATDTRVFIEPGLNYKMPEMTAAIANVSMGWERNRSLDAIAFGTQLRRRLDGPFDGPATPFGDATAWHKFRIHSDEGREFTEAVLDAAEIPYFDKSQDVPPAHYHPAITDYPGVHFTSIEGSQSWWDTTVAVGDRESTPFYGGGELGASWGDRIMAELGGSNE